MQNFQVIIFYMSSNTREIFKFALLYIKPRTNLQWNWWNYFKKDLNVKTKISNILVVPPLREKWLNTQFFLVSIFPQRLTKQIFVFSPNKIRTRKNSVFGHFSRSVCSRFMKDYIFHWSKENVMFWIMKNRSCSSFLYLLTTLF